MSALGPTPHVKILLDTDGQLYVFDQNTREKRLISMRKNADGTKTSRAPASEVEEVIWDFRYDHKDTKKGDAPIDDVPTESV